MSVAKVRLESVDSIAIVTFNDPATLNAMDLQMCDDLACVLDQVADAGNEYRCLLLTGEGRGFSSGANLAGDGTSNPGGGPFDAGAVLESHFNPLIARLHNLDIPIVTAVNGVAAGVGMSFALLGDLILAAESAYFLQAFTRIGLVPDGGATWLLPRLVGAARARELSLLADKLPAETALQWGLINRVCPNDTLMEDALALARKLASGPTLALGLTRLLYAASSDNTLAQQLDMERDYQRRAGFNPDAAEGVASFIEKRAPRFTGQR